MTYINKWAVLVLVVSPLSMANTLFDELSICAEDQDNLQRLACYDKLARKIKNNPPVQHKIQRPDPLEIATTEEVDNTIESVPKKTPESLSAEVESPKAVPVVPLQPVVQMADTISQQQAKFGQRKKQSSEGLIQQIQATIVKIGKAPFGKLIITLDNGQVWRQTDSINLRLREGQIVVIKRGALGSFFIGKENVNKRIRAKRVK